MTIFIKKFIDTDVVIEGILERVEDLCGEAAGDLLNEGGIYYLGNADYDKWCDALANEIYEKLAAKIARNYKEGD